MSSIHLNIKQWDPCTVKDTANVLVIGKRSSGKSTVVRDIINNKRDKLVGGIVVSPSPNDPMHPEAVICGSLDEGTNYINLLLKLKARPGTYLTPGNHFIVMDNCTCWNWEKTELSKELISNSKCYSLLYIQQIQYLLDLPPGVRHNLDYVIIAGNLHPDQREKVWEYFLKHVDGITRRQFNTAWTKCLPQYGCLIIDLTTSSSNIEDMLYWYRTCE